MPSSAIFIHDVAIQRRSTATAPVVPRTDYESWDAGPTVGTTWSTVSIVDGRVRSLTVDEVSTLADAGVVGYTGRGWLVRGSDVRVGDRLSVNGRLWDVRGVRDDPGGTDRFVVVELGRVDE